MSEHKPEYSIYICATCERQRPEDHSDWTRRDGLDFCPTCSTQPICSGDSE